MSPITYRKKRLSAQQSLESFDFSKANAGYVTKGQYDLRIKLMASMD